MSATPTPAQARLRISTEMPARNGGPGCGLRPLRGPDRLEMLVSLQKRGRLRFLRPAIPKGRAAGGFLGLRWPPAKVGWVGSGVALAGRELTAAWPMVRGQMLEDRQLVFVASERGDVLVHVALGPEPRVWMRGGAM